MIAKIIAHGATRDEALDRLAAALGRTIVAGPKTNVAFLKELCEADGFRAGTFDTGLHRPQSRRPRRRTAAGRRRGGAASASCSSSTWRFNRRTDERFARERRAAHAVGRGERVPAAAIRGGRVFPSSSRANARTSRCHWPSPRGRYRRARTWRSATARACPRSSTTHCRPVRRGIRPDAAMGSSSFAKAARPASLPTIPSRSISSTWTRAAS